MKIFTKKIILAIITFNFFNLITENSLNAQEGRRRQAGRPSTIRTARTPSAPRATPRMSPAGTPRARAVTSSPRARAPRVTPSRTTPTVSPARAAGRTPTVTSTTQPVTTATTPAVTPTATPETIRTGRVGVAGQRAGRVGVAGQRAGRVGVTGQRAGRVGVAGERRDHRRYHRGYRHHWRHGRNRGRHGFWRGSHWYGWRHYYPDYWTGSRVAFWSSYPSDWQYYYNAFPESCRIFNDTNSEIQISGDDTPNLTLPSGQGLYLPCGDSATIQSPIGTLETDVFDEMIITDEGGVLSVQE